LGRGAIHYFDRSAGQSPAAAGASFGGGSGGGQDPCQTVFGQALAGLAIGAGALVHRAETFEPEEGLNLAHDLTASSLGFENLPQETLEGQPQAIDALAAVVRLVLLGKEMKRKEAFQIMLQLSQGGLLDLLGGGTAGRGQAGSELREEGCVHGPVHVLCHLDIQCKMQTVNETCSPSIARLKERYERLRQSLARTGYISQGSVLQRSVSTSGRSGYQWTRKQARKTITVSLSREQFEGLKLAVANERELWETIRQMEKISRQILFQSLPDTRRRKRLRKKVLGLN
jgi:hypothetical protein